MPHTWDYLVYKLLCLASVTWHNAFESHHFVVSVVFLPIAEVVFNCVDVSQFV